MKSKYVKYQVKALNIPNQSDQISIEVDDYCDAIGEAINQNHASGDAIGIWCLVANDPELIGIVYDGELFGK